MPLSLGSASIPIQNPGSITAHTAHSPEWPILIPGNGVFLQIPSNHERYGALSSVRKTSIESIGTPHSVKHSSRRSRPELWSAILFELARGISSARELVQFSIRLRAISIRGPDTGSIFSIQSPLECEPLVFRNLSHSLESQSFEG